MFIFNLNIEKVHENLCTETKEPEQALEFAIAFEEEISESAKPNIKSEPVSAVEKTNHRELSSHKLQR